jgi:hypothetical protein
MRHLRFVRVRRLLAHGAALMGTAAAFACGGAAPEAPAAACSTTPRVLTDLPLARFASGIAVDDSHVWLDMNGVWKIPRAGGTLEKVSTAPPDTNLAGAKQRFEDSTHIYTVEDGVGIVRIPKNGDDPEIVATPDVSDQSFVMVLDGGFVYWTSSAGRLMRVAKTGGRPTTLAAFGPYDDDDYQGLLAVGVHEAFFAASPPGYRSHDDDPLLLVSVCK